MSQELMWVHRILYFYLDDDSYLIEDEDENKWFTNGDANPFHIVYKTLNKIFTSSLQILILSYTLPSMSLTIEKWTKYSIATTESIQRNE